VVKRLLACLPFLLLAGCVAPEARELRTTRGFGFVVQDDGSLTPQELEKVFSELSSSEKKILAFLGRNAMPSDFRSGEERAAAACPVVPPAETRVTVVSGSGRCHSDETGLTILREHLDRKDATHELVHYLAGGSWRPLDEGLAVYLTERIAGPAGGISVDTRARVYLDLSLDSSLDRDRLRSGMSRPDYDLAASFVKWLIEERGIDDFMALYHGASGDYHGCLGVPEQELLAKWRDKIRRLDVRQDGSYYRFKDFMTRSQGR
jgi:hypothetical protein